MEPEPRIRSVDPSGVRVLLDQLFELGLHILQRGVGVLAAWMAIAGLAAGAVTYAATVGLPFGDSSQPATDHVTSPAASNR